MSLATIPIGVAPGVEPRRRQLLYGATFAAGGSAMLILALLGAYLQQRTSVGEAWLSENHIPLTQPTMQLFTLLMSMFTVQWAVYSIARDQRGYAYLASGISIMLGLAFINQTWFLYTQVELAMDAVEAPLFYATTGAHLAMLGAAILALGLNALRSLVGAMSSRRPDGFSAAAIYWHVMAGLYFAIWLGVYVLK